MNLTPGIYILLTSPFEDHLKHKFKDDLITNKDFYLYSKNEYTHLEPESREFILKFLTDIIPNLHIKNIPCEFNDKIYTRSQWFIGDEHIIGNNKYISIEHLINMFHCIYCYDNIIINHFDSKLHPYIINGVIKEFFEFSSYYDFNSTIILDSYSPIIVSEFGRYWPSNVLIFNNNNDIFRLTEIRDHKWLENTILGSVYGTNFCGYNAKKEERI